MQTNSEKIWREHHKDLKRFIFSKVKDKHLTGDLLQETFIRLHTRNESEKILNEKAWLFRVASNLTMDHFRKKKQVVDIDTVNFESHENSPVNSPFSKCLPALMNKMPLKYKLPLVLADLKNMSQLQLAKILGISYPGAKSRVQRGRELLKKYIGECCEVIPDKYGNIIDFTPREKCACQSC